jgi:hypothetical protein
MYRSPPSARSTAMWLISPLGAWSPRRRARSAEIRQRIVDAARERMLDVGYRATTIAAVAANATEPEARVVWQEISEADTWCRLLLASGAGS